METKHNLVLRKTTLDDLDRLFEFQLDEKANHLAAFTAADPADKKAYIEKFTRLFADPSVNNFTIWQRDVIVGSIAKFEIDSKAEITYWIDRAFWGGGIASAALGELLATERQRPLFGRVAFDNIGSQKVLERCGFIRIGTDKGYANARKREIEEFVYRLD
ncbi:GNAT family N-acetyltransferase [Flavobacterium selenitireducens]|uniref:GNAT family N-acetyltransferase n=1 Tax=Flavobacterium selenitireducens TaxID=2722704 RepID=UPI00168BB860|nr:GNAT family N-acetyltransferase [Flavobacterium selenitireducens]MBD3582483.1 GNAT family N-acetyltransferase [Flavobacterium selenitireducens]